MTKVAVKKKDALKVLAQVKARYKGWGSVPTLVKDWDWYGGAPYAIVWEEGPYDWAIAATSGDYDEVDYLAAEVTGSLPKPKPPIGVEGVFVEPITSWSLGVYPS